MKNRPLREAARMLACHGLRIVCIIMLVYITIAPSGNVTSCHRKATRPTSMTAGSWRNRAMHSDEKEKPSTAQNTRNTVPRRTMNQYPSRTLE